MTPVGSPTPSTWQGARAAAGEGLIALFCPSQARAFSTKALNLSQQAAACAVVVGCYVDRRDGAQDRAVAAGNLSHRIPVLGSRTWQLPVGAVVLLRVAASILRRQPKGRASRLPGDHRRTGVSSREFCQLSF